MNLMKHKSLLLAAVASLVTAAVVAQAQVPGVNSTLNSVFTLAYDQSTMKPSYSATGSGTPASSTTDFCSLAGSATKTIKVRRVIVSAAGPGAGASAVEPLAVIKRSTAYTAGGGVAMAQVPYDSTNSLTGSTTNAGTSGMAEVWSSNPTAGTLTGTLADVLFFMGANSATGHNETFTFGALTSPVVLRGVAQQIAVNFGGTTITGSVGCTFEWTED